MELKLCHRVEVYSRGWMIGKTSSNEDF